MRAGRRRWGERPGRVFLRNRFEAIRNSPTSRRRADYQRYAALCTWCRREIDICFCGAIRKTEIAASVIVALGRSNDVAGLKVLIDLTRSRDDAWRERIGNAVQPCAADPRRLRWAYYPAGEQFVVALPVWFGALAVR